MPSGVAQSGSLIGIEPERKFVGHQGEYRPPVSLPAPARESSIIANNAGDDRPHSESSAAVTR